MIEISLGAIYSNLILISPALHREKKSPNYILKEPSKALPTRVAIVSRVDFL
jgi:hypothetical protein